MRSFFACLALLLIGAPLVAQPSPAPVVTSAQSAVARFIAAFNSPAPMRDFVEANFAQASLDRESAEQRALSLDMMKASAGGFTQVETTSQNDRFAESIVLTRQVNKHAKIVLFTSSREPGKITSLFILDARDPERALADAFPKKRVSDKQIVDLVNRRIKSLSGEDHFSGAVLVAHKDKVLLREAVGFADQSWLVPNKPSTRFHIASVGKMWTAIAVLRLAEQGKLSLEDSVARWVPGYPHADAAQRITLRMLLQHRGGLGEWDSRRLEQLTHSEAASTMTEAPREPDKVFGYSNAGYVLLAAAAEKASGMSFDRLMAEHVFEPAGMKRSGLWPVTAIVPDRATGYLRTADDPLGFNPRFANDQYLGFGADGSGGGYSTVDDMAAFHRALANGRLVKPETQKIMIDQSVEFVGAPRLSRYGLGLNLTDCADVPTLGHGGGGPNSGVSAVTYASLDGEWTIIVLSNYDPPAAEDLALDICKLVHRE